LYFVYHFRSIHFFLFVFFFRHSDEKLRWGRDLKRKKERKKEESENCKMDEDNRR